MKARVFQRGSDVEEFEATVVELVFPDGRTVQLYTLPNDGVEDHEDCVFLRTFSNDPTKEYKEHGEEANFGEGTSLSFKLYKGAVFAQMRDLKVGFR